MKKMLNRSIAPMLALALMPTIASAQSPEAPSRIDLAYAAGYKAQFLCSGLFNGGKTVADIEADELTGIYERIANIVPTLKADIDYTQKKVAVTFADDAPPRIALWYPTSGCIGMPIGFDKPTQRTAPPPRQFSDDQPWPMGDADAAITQTQGAMAIDRIAASAFRTGDHPSGNNAYGGKTSAVMVVRGDKIIWEAYKPGHDMHTTQRTWSVAKSIAGTLTGWRVLKGPISPKDPLAIAQFHGFGDPRGDIKLDHVLRMSSGLVSDSAGNRTDPIYMGGASVALRSASWPLLHKPGSHYRYANNDTLIAVQHLLTKDENFRPNDLLQKLGMTRTYIESDWQGTPILSSQVWTSARDLARMGMLYLNNGIWPYGKGGRERLLPENWLEYVSAPSGPQPDGAFGYGATFWLMNKSEDVPTDTIAGFGNRGQYLVIIPSRDIVIVRRGYDTREDRFDIAAFTRDIVNALEPAPSRPPPLVMPTTP